MTSRNGDTSKRHLYLAGEHRGNRRRDPTIRNLLDLGAGFLAEHPEQQVRLAAFAVGAIVQRVRLLLR